MAYLIPNITSKLMTQINDLVMTKHVLVFILISPNKTNKRIDQRVFGKYPKTGPVPETPVAIFPALDIVSAWAV